MLRKSLFALLASGTLATLAPAPAAAEGFDSTLSATCVGTFDPCEQVDFFLTLTDLPGETWLDYLRITLTNPLWSFTALQTGELEDAWGINSYAGAVTAVGDEMVAEFYIGAVLDPALTSTLRLRAQFDQEIHYFEDTQTLTFHYEAGDLGGALASGSVPAGAPTTVPEPISLALLGTGLAGVGALRRRRRRTDAA